MQILFDSSEEFGHHRGLGLISGNVLRISETDHYGNILPVPHIGWSATFCNKNRVNQRKYDLFRGLESTQKFYYLHSYAANVVDEDAIIAQTLYGGFPIIATAGRENVFGTQFHPEKVRLLGSTYYEILVVCREVFSLKPKVADWFVDRLKVGPYWIWFIASKHICSVQFMSIG